MGKGGIQIFLQPCYAADIAGYVRRYGPVSYTHLDVYKRQEFGRSNQIVCMVPRGDTAREKALSDAFKTIPEVTAVSYTHLDVYKRQI